VHLAQYDDMVHALALAAFGRFFRDITRAADARENKMALYLINCETRTFRREDAGSRPRCDWRVAAGLMAGLTFGSV